MDLYYNWNDDLDEEEIARKWAQSLSDDELVDVYCDWGAMGRNADCTPEEWDAVQEELDKRWKAEHRPEIEKPF